LNFAGKSGSHADFGSSTHSDIASLSVTVPDAHLLFSGDYARSGADLIISDHLHRVVVPNYFHGDKRPALVSPEGAPLDSKVIDALTGHVQYAQAGTAAAAKVVGHVVKMTGSASIVRNGVTIDVNNGDNVYQNDVVQTGSGSTLGLVMIDGTTFNLTANARLMMNDLTYDATSTSNTSLFTLVQGAATFVAGQVAKTGDMKVATPVATMGIRGTAVILDISAIDGTVSVSVVNQRDGQIHALQVYNARGDLIGTVTSNGSTLTLRPTATFEVIAQESNKTVAQVLTEFNAFQQLLSTYEIGKQLAPNTPFPTDGRRGDNTQQPLTKFAGSTISPIDSTTTKFNADIGGAKDAKSDAGTGDAATLKATGDGTGLLTKVAVTVGDGPVQFVEVAATSIPFVVTPSPVSRISSGPGDHFGPAMSADGQFVTYDPDGAIYLFDRPTGATKTIASPGGGLTYGSPTISSDGHFVVYQGSDGAHSWIFIYNNDASDPAHYGQTTRLMAGGQAAISGDGSKLVTEQGGSIGLYDQQGHELANITGAAVGITGTLWKPAISADGHVIAFWSSDLSSPGGAGQLFSYDLSTATVRSIASTATGAGNNAASFSADGHYAVYQSDAPDGHSEIYLYDLRAGQVVFHTANAESSYNPVLSPDGHFIILASDARLTAEDKNAVADIYVVDVTDLSHPVYKLVSVLDDGTQGDDASNLGAAISAGGQFIAFGSRASNFSSHDTPGTGDIFVIDPTSGHSAIILESGNSPAVLGASGVIALTGDHSGVTLGVSDSRITASFDSHGDIQWSFSEPRSDFASLQPGEIAVRNFVITLSTDRSTTEIPVKISIYDVDQAAVSVADAAPVASPVTLAAGTEDTSTTISAAALLAGVTDIDGPSLSISAVGILSGGGAIVDNHDGTFRYAPAPNYNGPVVFSYSASDGTLSASSTATLDLAGSNDAPSVTKARFAVSEGGTVVLGAANIGVSDPDSTSFTFTVSNVTHGQLQTTANGSTWVDATIFTSADLAAGHVRFVHDGGEDAPAFSIQADDGEAFNHLSATVAGTIDFTNVNDAPTVSSPVTGRGAEGSGPATVHLLDFASDADPGTVLRVANLVWTDTGSGFPAGFAVSPDGNSIAIDTNSLAYNSLAEGETFTAHFGYDVVDEHGASVHQTATVAITGTNDAPTVTSAGFSVSEGGTVVLGAANIGVADPDSASFTFTVTDLGHGTFQITSNGNIWASANTFTTADLNAGHVRFVHDGGEVAPTFLIRASDGAAINNQSNVLAGNVSFTPVNDAPVITTANLTIQEGGTVVLGASNFAVTDPDNNSFVFTASNVSHGTFQLTADGSTWVPVTTFNTTNLNAGHVRFVHDGGEDAPAFSIQADDGTGLNSLSNVLVSNVNFSRVNDAPVVTNAGFAISEGGTAVLSAANIGVSDPDSASFTFTATGVTHGAFQTTTNGAIWIPATTFTTADLNAGHVRFVHDGGEDAPAFSIQADDGTGSNSLSNVFVGSVGFSHVNDAPVDHVPGAQTVNEDTSLVFTGANAITISDVDAGSGGETVTLMVGSGTLALGSTADLTSFTNNAASITLTGTVAHINTALDGLTYRGNLNFNGPDTLNVVTHDNGNTGGSDLTASGSVAIHVTGVNDRPVVIAGHTLNYTENQIATAIDTAITVSDVDSASLASATVQITGNYVKGEDLLGFTDQNGIHGSFDAATGTLTLTGSSSVANYQTALASVTYVNTSDNPSGAARAVTIVTNDGALDSLAATDAIHVTPVNDAPVAHASLTISQGHTVTLTTADISFDDPDSSVVTYTVSHLSHGHFEIGVGNDADETTTFTSADVAAGLVSFVDDGSSTAPAFSLTPNDGSIDGVEVQGVVTFSASNYTLTSSEGVTINVTPEGATSGFVFPGAGNVTTPGTPEDRIAIGYDAGGSHVVLDNAPLLGVHQMASLGSETHSSGGTTFVSATLDAGHDVTLKQTLALGSDANFFTTTIDITNNGAADISNLRFLRNFDPDQDVQAHHDYTTFNDVVQNPDGAETFAILSATGVESHTKVAMVGLGAEWRASVFGFTNTDPYATGAFDTPVDPNGARADKSLSLTSSLGTLAAGDHVEVTYITTNNVATAGSNALFGTDHADSINGLGGDDLLIGLGGDDTFVFNAASRGSGHDTIADFTPGHDHIELDYHAFDAAGQNDFSSWLRTHATDINNNNDVLIDLNVDGLHPGLDTILLKNVVSASLSAGDFHTL
jgi:VCBS repeat-containing protein